MSDLLNAVTADDLSEALKTAGYQVTAREQNGEVQLHSASQGFGFTVRWGNRAPESAPGYLDFGYSFVLRLEGDLQPAFVDNWNRAKRFAKLSRHGEFLVLEWDVVVAGGVTRQLLVATAQLWGRLMQEFFQYIHNPKAIAEQLDGAPDRTPPSDGYDAAPSAAASQPVGETS